MIKLIIYAILFYFLYKAIVYFMRYISGNKRKDYIKDQQRKSNPGYTPKKDIEEADYREIKDDDDK